MADNDVAKATQAIVGKWIAANQVYDADAVLSHYSDDITWMDYGYNDGLYHGGVFKGAVREWFASEALKEGIKSYLVKINPQLC